MYTPARARVSFEWTPLYLSVLFVVWLLQIHAITAHICFATFVVGLLGFSADNGALAPAYALLAFFFALFLLTIIAQVVLYFRDRLRPNLYLQIEAWKICASLIELLILWIFVLVRGYRGEGAAVLTQLVGLTALSQIPFLLGAIFAEMMCRKEESDLGISMPDERRPLLSEIVSGQRPRNVLRIIVNSPEARV